MKTQYKAKEQRSPRNPRLASDFKGLVRDLREIGLPTEFTNAQDTSGLSRYRDQTTFYWAGDVYKIQELGIDSYIEIAVDINGFRQNELPDTITPEYLARPEMQGRYRADVVYKPLTRNTEDPEKVERKDWKGLKKKIEETRVMGEKTLQEFYLANKY
jgi:hypothetical protein